MTYDCLNIGAYYFSEYFGGPENIIKTDLCWDPMGRKQNH